MWGVLDCITLWNSRLGFGLNCYVLLIVYFCCSMPVKYCTTGWKTLFKFVISHIIQWYIRVSIDIFSICSYTYEIHNIISLFFVRSILVFGQIFCNQVISFLCNPLGIKYHVVAPLYKIQNLCIVFH